MPVMEKPGIYTNILKFELLFQGHEAATGENGTIRSEYHLDSDIVAAVIFWACPTDGSTLLL